MPTLSIELTVGQANRLARAFGRIYSLRDGDGAPRDATADEVRQFVIAHLRATVHANEDREAKAALPALPGFDPI